MEGEASQHKGAQSGPGDEGIPGLDWNFLHKTAIAIALTLVVVSSTVGMRYYAWGLRYGLTGFWILLFLISSAFIFRYIMFERKVLKGLGVVGVKIGLLVLFYWMLTGWPVTDAEGKLISSQALAMVCGLVTPFVVLMLRVVGFVMNQQRRSELAALFGPQAASSRVPPADGPGKTTKL